MKLVSACLLGVRCRYDGKSALERRLLELARKGELLPVCPEQLGGLPTPRERAWIVGGDGSDVLSGKASVMTRGGKEVTENFIRGAEEVLKLARSFRVREAVFKSKSPSCGSREIYGSFSQKPMEGDGVTSALLNRNGLRVLTEKDL